MSDVEPHEVDTLVRNLLCDILHEPDEVVRYHLLTREQALYEALISAIVRMRGKELAALRKGRTAKEVAEIVGLGTRQRVEQLIAGATRH